MNSFETILLNLSISDIESSIDKLDNEEDKIAAKKILKEKVLAQSSLKEKNSLTAIKAAVAELDFESIDSRKVGWLVNFVIGESEHAKNIQSLLNCLILMKEIVAILKAIVKANGISDQNAETLKEFSLEFESIDSKQIY